MKKNDLIIIADYTQEIWLSFDDLCEICRSTPEFIHELILHDILVPKGRNPEQWQFDMRHLIRAKMARRLQHDLDMNVPSIAVVLDLLEEIEDLRTRMSILERHFLK